MAMFGAVPYAAAWHDDEAPNGRIPLVIPQAPSPLEPHSAAFDSPALLDQLHLFPLPVPEHVQPRPISHDEQERMQTLSGLQFFLATAPSKKDEDPEPDLPTSIRKFTLPNGEAVSCVKWNNLFHLTGTDIVRALAFRFEAFGRPVKATKKWEEGVFSDLRNLKPGTDACLEEPKSPLLDYLFRNGCIRTQKKQKVFYWFAVPHDRLFLDALERDLKRQKAGQEPTTVVTGEPARSFTYDPRRGLYEQFAGQNRGIDVIQTMDHETMTHLGMGADYASMSMLSARASPMLDVPLYDMPLPGGQTIATYGAPPSTSSSMPFQVSPQASTSNVYTGSGGIFAGSPAYKRRRLRSRHATSPSVIDQGTIPLHRALTPQASYTSSSMRSITASPRMHSQVPGRVSGLPPRLERRSPNPVKRERESSQLQDESSSAEPERLHPCSYPNCDSRFKRYEHLKRHLRTHTRERPYVCSKCTRSFSRQDNLTSHARTHSRSDGGEDGTAARIPFSYEVTPPIPNGAIFPRHSSVGVFPRSNGGHVDQAVPSMPFLTNTRPSTVPPEWPSVLAESTYGTMPSGHNLPIAPLPTRRIRSATPSAMSSSYGPINASVLQTADPVWTEMPSHGESNDYVYRRAAPQYHAGPMAFPVNGYYGMPTSYEVNPGGYAARDHYVQQGGIQ